MLPYFTNLHLFFDHGLCYQQLNVITFQRVHNKIRKSSVIVLTRSMCSKMTVSYYILQYFDTKINQKSRISEGKTTNYDFWYIFLDRELAK